MSLQENEEEEEQEEEQALIPGLPRSIAQNCLARVPRGLYWQLKLVSRAWNSALEAEAIYPIRNNEGVAEEAWLYLTLQMGGPFHALDPALMAWRTLPATPSDQIFTTSDKECFVAGRELLVVGPTFQGMQIGPVVWRYRLDCNLWSIAPPMIVSRCLFASASTGSVAYIAGGARFSTRIPLREAEMFNSKQNRWEVLPSMVTARKECSGFILDGCFFVIGGSNDRDEPVTAGERYDPRTRNWSPVAGLWPESSVARLRGGSLAPPLVAVVRNQLYAWDHPNGLLKRYDKISGLWVVLDAAPGRRANPESHGWGLGFKGVGDELWLIGGSEPEVPFIDACRPDPNSGRVNWRRVARIWGNHSFVYNCTVMKA